MFALFLTTTLTCSQVNDIINRVKENSKIPKYVRMEILDTLRETIPTCPVIIEENARRKSN